MKLKRQVFNHSKKSVLQEEFGTSVKPAVIAFLEKKHRGEQFKNIGES